MRSGVLRNTMMMKRNSPDKSNVAQTANPVIAVPLYKDFKHLRTDEMVSLNRLVEILYNYPIRFFIPNSLSIEEYKKFFAGKEVDFLFETFDNFYFENIESYSKLMLSKEFYQRFSNYSHLLIYQPDAYVFRDELLQWCVERFDYIGAPWIEDKSGKHLSGKITGVGNGGFCLRKINTAIRVLTSKRPFKSFSQLKAEYSFGGFRLFFRYPKILFKRLTGYKNTGHYYASRFLGSEDAFWCELAADSLYAFHLPDVRTAIRFSFEVAPRQLYEMNDQKLPFGCHAWFKHDPEFWKKYIPI